MIKFDIENKLQWKEIEPEQANTYIHFLNMEKARHLVERAITDQKAKDALRENNELLSKLWESAHTRHQDDINAIEKLIRQVKEYHGV